MSPEIKRESKDTNPLILLTVGTTIVSIFGLIFDDIISSEEIYGSAFFVGAAALLIWLVVRVGHLPCNDDVQRKEE